MIWNNCHAGACSQQRSDSLPALLHIDTGMNRLGFDADQINQLIENKPALDEERRYLMSHRCQPKFG